MDGEGATRDGVMRELDEDDGRADVVFYDVLIKYRNYLGWWRRWDRHVHG